MTRWCFILFCYICVISGFEEKGFVFTAPKIFWSGKRDTACLSLHGYNDKGKANVTVNIESNSKNNAITKKTIDTGNPGCFEIRVPNNTDPYSRSKLYLQVKFHDSNYTINGVENVNILPNSNIMFIQTDKEVYKPGDRVKIRILLLSNELGVRKNLKIPIVKIRNPIGIAIGQWENITTDFGFVQLEHQLSQDTLLGSWMIELDDDVKIFEVKEYILPRFVVSLKDFKESVYYYEKIINITVCAKYSYGLNVKGIAFIHIRFFPFEQGRPVNQMKELVNGCALFEIKSDEIKGPPFDFSYEVEATVTERGTDQVEKAKEFLYLHKQKYVIEFDNKNQYFQYGLPFHGQVQISRINEDISNKTLMICYNPAFGESWNLTKDICRDFPLKDGYIIPFTIFPMEENIHTIRLRAEVENDRIDEQYFYINRWYSTSNSYLSIERNNSGVIKCKSWQQFNVLYTFNDTLVNNTIMFNYLIMSKGHIIKQGQVAHVPNFTNVLNINDYRNIIGNVKNLTLPVGKFILPLKINQKMYGGAQLIVYYVRQNDGEVVAAVLDLEVEKCLSNKVEANWLSGQKYPGESTTLKIKAAAGSLCAVSATDKRVDFLSKTSHIDVNKFMFKIDKPFWPEFDHNICPSGTIPPYWDLRKKRSIISPGYFSDYSSTKKAFQSKGMIIMTDLKLPTPPCKNVYPHQFPIMRGGFAMDEFGGGMARPAVMTVGLPAPIPEADLYQVSNNIGPKKRTHFPETWLWELTRIGRSGETQLKRNIPDSITEWIGHVYCISPSAGLGISQSTHITAFQPFFVEVLTPYSIKRHETLHLKVLVFNYLNHSLPVRVTLNQMNGAKLMGSPDEASTIACIEPNDSIYNVFRITATALEKVNVSVTAEVESSYPGECGPEVIINMSDTIVKPLRVEIEGFPVENIKSAFVCIDENSNETSQELKWMQELPNDVIKDSTKFKIVVDNDILGLAMQNFDSLLNVPTGCGEQIMSKLAPNLYVIKYLSSMGNISKETYDKAVNNMKIGYERILQYKHQDGSFSAFGPKYGEGSMFLTAFVVKTLSQASKYIYIDENTISNAVSWILNKQLENGCFPATSHVFHSGLNEKNGNENTALTAYVLISLIEANVTIPENVKNNAKYCLRGYNTIDKYALAVSTYAVTLLNWEEETDRSIKRLLEIASRYNSMTWWENSESMSSGIEMTSYVILALLKTNSSEYIAAANGAARWLTTQRNSFGGYYSTQDTVVALDALTKYALTVKSKETNLTIAIKTAGKQYIYKIRDTDKLKTKQLNLKTFTDSVSFNLTGQGCVILQSILKYNMPHVISSEALKLDMSVKPVSTIDKCSIAEITPCISYKIKNKKSNMAILDVALPSGYRADHSTLRTLTKGYLINRYEEIENRVIFYFTNLTNKEICVPFNINENSVVESREPAIVKLYDYYDPEISISTTYVTPKCINTIDDYVQDESISSIDNKINTNNDFDLSGLNPDFIDMDIDLDEPGGREGPKPVYVKAPKNFQ